MAVSNTALAWNNLAAEPELEPPRQQPSQRAHEHLESRADSPANGRPWQDTSIATETLRQDSLAEGAGESKDHSEQPPEDDDGLLFNENCLNWLLDRQRAEPDPVTEVPGGGWASSDAAGALPNTVATAGVLSALAKWLHDHANVQRKRLERAADRGIQWLLDLQNEDGGWPTYYRDDSLRQHEESSPDVTSQVLRSLAAWWREWQMDVGDVAQQRRSNIDERMVRAVESGWRYLEAQQRTDGSFIPLWFGNEHQPNERNPVYGTAQVLLASMEAGRLESNMAQRAARWLVAAQHANGGWGPPRSPVDYSGAEKDGFGARRTNEAMASFCSIEETSLALSALIALAGSNAACSQAVSRGLAWLINAVEQDGHRRPAIVGYYLPKLWYYERLYPLVFAAGALTRAVRSLAPATPTASHAG